MTAPTFAIDGKEKAFVAKVGGILTGVALALIQVLPITSQGSKLLTVGVAIIGLVSIAFGVQQTPNTKAEAEAAALAAALASAGVVPAGLLAVPADIAVPDPAPVAAAPAVAEDPLTLVFDAAPYVPKPWPSLPPYTPPVYDPPVSVYTPPVPVPAPEPAPVSVPDPVPAPEPAPAPDPVVTATPEPAPVVTADPAPPVSDALPPDIAFDAASAVTADPTPPDVGGPPPDIAFDEPIAA